MVLSQQKVECPSRAGDELLPLKLISVKTSSSALGTALISPHLVPVRNSACWEDALSANKGKGSITSVNISNQGISYVSRRK